MLGLGVPSDLRGRWSAWLAPDLQPFFVDDPSEWPERLPAPAEGLTPELRDTFKVWRLHRRGEIVWLDEEAFLGLERRRRARLVRLQVTCARGAVPSVRRWADLLPQDGLRAQGDGHRFVWWQSLVGMAPGRILERFVTDEADVTRHQIVATATWRRCTGVLPGARSLAGTFPPGSGPNCFGTVLAAAGVRGAGDEWIQQPTFETWLKRACLPGGRDDDAGTVLVWRDQTGLPVHAAVTIGDGLALEKAAQTWWTPRIVGTVDDVKRASRAAGQRLERHRIVAGEAGGDLHLDG